MNEQQHYRAGDYVYPAHLPRPMLCRVVRAEMGLAPTGAFQILVLEPLDGPWALWPEVAQVIRLDEDVVPARARDLWCSGAAPSSIP